MKGEATYVCPSDDAAGRAWYHPGVDVHFARSNGAVCFGTGGMAKNTLGQYVESAFLNPSADMDTDGAFRPVVARRLKDFTDGTSSSALASEVLAGKDYVASSPGSLFDERGLWVSQGRTGISLRNRQWDCEVDAECGTDLTITIDVPCRPANRDRPSCSFEVTIKTTLRHTRHLNYGKDFPRQLRLTGTENRAGKSKAHQTERV